MLPTFTYDKLASSYLRRGRALAIDYEKIAVSNGKIVLRKNVNDEIESGSRAFQNNMTLNTATIRSHDPFFDKTFLNCEKLNEAYIDNDNLLDISNAFRNTKLTRCFFVPSIRNISFAYCNTDIETANFQAPNLLEMRGAFQDCKKLKNVSITSLNKLKSANFAFANCEELTNINIDMPNATEIIGLFSSCLKLKDVYLRSKASRAVSLFQGCIELTNVRLTFTGKVVSTAGLFLDSGLENYKVNFNTENVVIMISMFENCKYLKTIDLSNISTKKVYTMQKMFKDCSSLTDLDLTSFDFSSIPNEEGLYQFLENTNLETLRIKKEWFSYTYYNALNYIGTIANVYQIPFYITDIDEEENNYILTLSKSPKVKEENILVRGMKIYRSLEHYKTLEEAMETTIVQDNTITFTENITGDITNLNYSTIKFKDCSLMNVYFKDLPCRTIEFDNASIEMNNVQNPAFQNLQNLETLKGFNLRVIYRNANEYIDDDKRSEYLVFENCENIKTFEGPTSISTQFIEFPDQYMIIELPNLESIDVLNINTAKSNVLKTGEYFEIDTPRLKFINETNIHILGSNLKPMFKHIERINKLKISGNCEELFYNVRSLKSLGEVFISTENGVRADCTNMFAYCKGLETIESLIVFGDTRYMFRSCTSLSTIDYINLRFVHSKLQIDEWYLDYMFYGCENLAISSDNFDVDDTSAPVMLIHANYMFNSCPIDAAKIISKLFSEISNAKRPYLYINNACQGTTISDLSDFTLNKPTKVFANYLFSRCDDLEDVNLTLTNAASIEGLFANCENLKTVTYLNIRNDLYESINALFKGCESLETINNVMFNKDNIFKAAYLFYGCRELVDYGTMDMSQCPNLKDVTAMYQNNIHLKTYIPLPENVLHSAYTFFNTSIEVLGDVYFPSTDNVSYMFSKCKQLKSVKRLSANNAKVEGLFEKCDKLEKVGLLDVRTSINDGASDDMFNQCPSLQYVGLSEHLHLTIIDGTKMLYHEWANNKGANCKVFNQSNDNMNVFKELEMGNYSLMG